MRTILVAIAAGTIVVSGCGGADTTVAEPAGQTPSAVATPAKSAVSPRPLPESATASPRGTTVKLARSQFGSVLFDASGQAIYLFDKEKSATPECYGECAQAWPPVLTDGPPIAVAGARNGLLGTTKRIDGTTQVTYAGHPLYFYAHEGKNEVKCHNIAEFGGVWLAVAMTGEGAPH